MSINNDPATPKPVTELFWFDDTSYALEAANAVKFANPGAITTVTGGPNDPSGPKQPCLVVTLITIDASPDDEEDQVRASYGL